MLESYLIRYKTGDHGTFGRLYLKNWSCFMLELPYFDNKRNISCIPDGDYICKIVKSPRFGYVFGLLDVPNRSHILIHSGNWAGDVSKGFKSNSNGCLLPGMIKGSDKRGQKTVWRSRQAIRGIMKHTKREPFLLKIRSLHYV